MGIAYALAAMASFGSNILLTRFAVARLPVEAGFFIVLATNIVFPLVLFFAHVQARDAAFAWHWWGFALFLVSGVIGTFMGRRMLFDAVRILGTSRASVFHSSAPAFALLGAWLLAGEALGLYELVLVAIVWAGLWLTHPPVGSSPGEARLSADLARKGFVTGLLAVAGFGVGNVFRGLAIRSWDEALLGTTIASVAALVLQAAVTRDWPKIAAQLRGADRRALGLYFACGIATSLGSIFVTLAMTHIEIGLAVLVVHTTPVLVIPVSVFLLKQKEAITARTLAGTALVLAGIAALALR